MNSLFDRFILNVVVHLVDKPSGREIMLKGVPSGGTRVEELQRDEAIWTLKCEFIRLKCRWNCDRGFSRQNCSEATADLEV